MLKHAVLTQEEPKLPSPQSQRIMLGRGAAGRLNPHGFAIGIQFAKPMDRHAGVLELERTELDR